MKKNNVVDFFTYLNRRNNEEPKSLMSEELSIAIQSLINRLRESGPLQ